MRRSLAACGVFLALLLGGAVSGASPAAADHTTCASGNYNPAGLSGYIQYSMCWKTNTAHTGVKPYYWTATNYLNNGAIVQFTNQAYYDYPGGYVATSNQRQLQFELFQPQPYLSNGQGFGQSADVPFDSPPYALKSNSPTWRIFFNVGVGTDRYSYVLASRITG